MFTDFAWCTGTVYADPHGALPSALHLWDGESLQLNETDTHFGYVLQGRATVSAPSGQFELSAGMYFCVPGSCTIAGENSRGLISSRLDWQGLFSIGGPIEGTGRLRYIDGCSDTLLIPPVLCGDPCLNLLHIPPGTAQTQHTHPSLRSGVVVSGCGVCRTPARDIPLQTGTVFVIPAETEHSFHTKADDLRVIAWHPDSDTGPTHDDHPMINRTIVDGISAANIPEIRT